VAKPVQLARLAEVLARWLPASGQGDTQNGAICNPPIFNPDDLLRRLMGDRKLAGTVLKGFLQDAPRQLNHLRARLQEADAPGTRSQAYVLKGAAATVAAESLCALALALEQAGAAGQLDRCGVLLPRAAEEFERFQNTLERDGWVEPNSRLRDDHQS